MDALTLGKVKLTVLSGDERRSLGRVEVNVIDGHATAVNRRSRTEVARGEVVSVEQTGRRSAYTITLTDGTTWLTAGCGCGGG